jgi:glyoxylase-like metal-dependent hydrolase (beta-lactamase superfamily II)
MLAGSSETNPGEEARVQVADKWFEWTRIDDGITLLWEPHVDPLIRCNIWHVRGGARDLVIDSGLGMASLVAAAQEVFERPVTAVATHSHYDHIGGFHEFEERVAHRLEAETLAAPGGFASLVTTNLDRGLVASLQAAGYAMPDTLVDALPHAGYDIAAYRVAPAPATRLVEEGDIVEVGQRRFEVLHLPGHSPGSIGLWEAETGVFFSGDAVYDGPLLDELPGSDIAVYLKTMERLLELPVTVVHAGHDPSFGRDRLRELARAYIEARA